MAIQEAHYHGRHEQRLASKAQSRTKAFRVLASRLEQMGTSVKIPSQYSIQNIQLTRITHSYRFLQEHPRSLVFSMKRDEMMELARSSLTDLLDALAAHYVGCIPVRVC